MDKLTTKNPFTGQPIKEYPMDNFKSAEGKVATANEVQLRWSRKDLRERLELVRSALNYFEENREIIARDISEQMGRPISQSNGEVSGLLQRARYMCEIAEDTLAPDVIENSEDFYRAIQHVPLGTIFVISAWNYPLLITINSVVPALISGNAVILKHSSTTPEIGLHFEKAFIHLGDCVGLLQNIIVDHAVTGQIIEELPIHHVVFTGSVGGGRKILEHCSKKFMTPQLELGGKDAAFVDKDANLDLAAETLVDGAMFNSGQSCCGIERAYIHKAVFSEFLEKAKKLIGGYQLGDPSSDTTNLGPLASPGSVDSMLGQVKKALASGATIVCGGNEQVIGKARFMEPTLLTSDDNQLDIFQEENFGPILPLRQVEDREEAIKLINDSRYGLTSSIFTSDIESARIFAEHVNTGTVFMNRCDYLDPALPWTGVKDSGVGSSLSKYGYYGLTRRKSIHFKKPR